MEAVNTDIYCMEYLCNKIRIICAEKGSISSMYDMFHNPNYNMNDYEVITKMIQNNIDSNLNDDCLEGELYTFYSTTFHAQGMSRKEWAETILAPLALELPDY
jgi:hypothetical protein